MELLLNSYILHDMSSSLKINFNSLDLFKFLMAILVIAIHTDPLEGVTSPILKAFFHSATCCAVPFFFLAAGFLLALKLKWPYMDNDSLSAILRYQKKMVKYYLMWSVIYLPLACLDYIDSEISVTKAVVLYIRGLVCIGEHYNSWILWYLLSCIYALLAIFLCLKRKMSPYMICVLGTISLGVAMFLNFIVGAESLPSYMPEKFQKFIVVTIGSGRLFLGFFYMAFGMLLAKYQMLCKKYSVLLLALSFFLSVLFNDSVLKMLFTAFCSITLFMTVLNIRLNVMFPFTLLRKISTDMYFWHLYIWTALYTLLYGEKRFGLIAFLGTLVCVTLLSFFLCFVKEKTNKQIER